MSSKNSTCVHLCDEYIINPEVTRVVLAAMIIIFVINFYYCMLNYQLDYKKMCSESLLLLIYSVIISPSESNIIMALIVAIYRIIKISNCPRISVLTQTENFEPTNITLDQFLIN